MHEFRVEIEESVTEEISEIAGYLGVDEGKALQLVIERGLERYRTERALDLLGNHEVTIRKAAEIADESYLDMMELATSQGIDIGYTDEEIKRDLEKI